MSFAEDSSVTRLWLFWVCDKKVNKHMTEAILALS